MRLLLDTHVILWWLSGDGRFGPKSRRLITDDANQVLVSVVSLWEITMKVRAGKLQADVSEIEWDLTEQGFGSLGVEKAHLWPLSTLPVHHGDPFDHMLIAQAIVEGATLLTADRVIRRYPVRYLDCGL